MELVGHCPDFLKQTWDALRKRGSATAGELALQLGISRINAAERLRLLTKRGLVQRYLKERVRYKPEYCYFVPSVRID